jgi:hypothetical protein
MFRIDKERLALSLRQEVAVMMDKAKLAARLSWPEGVKVQDLAKTGTHADRFNDGKFEVSAPGVSWVFDGNVDARGFEVNWTAEIEPITGSVYAFPSVRTEQVSGDHRGYELLGLRPTLIGVLGPLEAVLPPIEGLSAEYHLPNVYARVKEARETRAFLARLCAPHGA